MPYGDTTLPGLLLAQQGSSGLIVGGFARQEIQPRCYPDSVRESIE